MSLLKNRKLGIKLKEARLARNMSWSAVSRQTKVNTVTLKRIEQGEDYQLKTAVRLICWIEGIKNAETLLPKKGETMSERYGKCKSCKGKGEFKNSEGETNECLFCGGTGHSGDAMDYYQKQLDAEWESQRQTFYYTKPMGEI